MTQLWRSNRLWLSQYADAASLAVLDGVDCRSLVQVQSDGVLFSYAGAESRRTPLHSRRDPLGEARRQVRHWLEAENVDVAGLVVLVGLAGGYHVQALLECLQPGATLLVLDSDPAAVRTVAAARDLACAVPGEVSLVIAVHSDVYELSACFRDQVSQYECLQLAVWTPPGLQRACGNKYLPLRQRLLEVGRRVLMDRTTYACLSAEWLEHGIANLPTLLRNPGVQALRGAFAGRPALVVAAGPTLNQSLELVKAYQDRAVVIAVGTALKPLLAAGIVPHLVVIVDGDPISLRQIEGLPAVESFLVSCGNLYPPIMQVFAKQMFVFRMGGLAELCDWVEQMDVHWAPMRTGGTVSLTALDLALLLGCRPIMALGLDLAFDSDGTSHARQTMYDGHRYQVESLLEVPGNYQPTVLTNKQFAVYIEFLSDYALQFKHHMNFALLNVTTGGAALHGFELVSPTAAAQLLEEMPRFQVWDELRRRYRDADRLCQATIVQRWRQAEAELAALREQAGTVLTLCQEAKPGSAQWQALATEEKQLKLDEGAGVLVNGALRYISMQLLGDPRQRATANAEQLQELSVQLYGEIQAAATWLQGQMRKSFLAVEQPPARVVQ